MPSNVLDLTGIPMTGRVVPAAMAPARWAALPAAAMMAPKPFSRAERAKAAASAGVRWAESTRTSQGTPNWSRVRIAPSRTGRSLSLPMMMAIFFMLASCL